ncbi:MAG: hypothetical protein OEY51_11105, partial [Cyclobacteriaceae bacterium]|nr:hypothetical protein [Cyclobacteriaceae bacterium]
MLKSLRNYVSNPATLSVGLVFGLMSIIFTFWVTRIPELKMKLNLSESELGLALLFIPIGSILSMLLSSGIINKTGAGKSTGYAVIYSSLASIFPLFAHTMPVFCL